MNSTDPESDDIINDTEKKSTNVECNDIGRNVSPINGRFYTYHLIDPRTKLPFYVGKGCGNRYKRHVSLVQKNKIPNNNQFLFRIIRKILLDGYDVEYAFVDRNIAEERAFELEVSEIRRLRSLGVQLCNLTDGGDGVTMTPDVRKKIGNRMRGRTFRTESIEKMRKSKLGKRDTPELSNKRKIWLSGHIVHAATREKLRLARLGKYKKDLNGKYQKLPTDVIDRIVLLYNQLKDVRAVQNQLRLDGCIVSWNVIKKRLVDANVYLGCRNHFS